MRTLEHVTETTPPGRRERAKAEKRARIIGSARSLLDSMGYAAMTMAEVADRADVAAGTLFQYAATKPELLMLVTEQRWRPVLHEAAGRAHGIEDPASAIRTLLAPLLDAADSEPETTAAIAREILFGADGPHRSAVTALVADLEAEIRAALRGRGGAERTDAAARLIVSGGLVELNRTRNARADRRTAERRLDALIDLVIQGLTRSS